LSTEITDDRNYEWFGEFLLRPMGGVSLITAAMALACRDLELSVRFVLWSEAAFLLLTSSRPSRFRSVGTTVPTL
jgi:hypothetical protein